MKTEDSELGEIYQSIDLELALLRKDNPNEFTKITSFVHCRDFLVDSYTYSLSKQDFGIYGFSFKGSTESPDWSGTYLLLKFPDRDTYNNLQKNIKYLHQIEDLNMIPRTRIEDADEGSVVIGSSMWLSNCLYFSLYTLLIRLACIDVSEPEDYQEWIEKLSELEEDHTDCAYIASIPESSLTKVLQDLRSIETDSFCGFDPKKHSVYEIHHNSGFVSVFGNHTELSKLTVKKNEHWMIMKDRGFKLRIA